MSRGNEVTQATETLEPPEWAAERIPFVMRCWFSLLSYFLLPLVSSSIHSCYFFLLFYYSILFSLESNFTFSSFILFLFLFNKFLLLQSKFLSSSFSKICVFLSFSLFFFNFYFHLIIFFRLILSFSSSNFFLLSKILSSLITKQYLLQKLYSISYIKFILQLFFAI